MGSGGRPYRGVSETDRQAERRARLIAASVDLVAEDGVAATTAEAIAHRAGLSKRYFYESFEDRDAVLLAALDQVFADIGARIVHGVVANGGDVRQRVASSVDASLDILRLDRGRSRLYAEAAGIPALSTRQDELIETYIDYVAETVLDAPPSEHNRLAATIFVVASSDIVGRWIDGQLSLDREQLVAYVVELGAALHDRLVLRP